MLTQPSRPTLVILLDTIQTNNIVYQVCFKIVHEHCVDFAEKSCTPSHR